MVVDSLRDGCRQSLCGENSSEDGVQLRWQRESRRELCGEVMRGVSRGESSAARQARESKGRLAPSQRSAEQLPIIRHPWAQPESLSDDGSRGPSRPFPALQRPRATVAVLLTCRPSR